MKPIEHIEEYLADVDFDDALNSWEQASEFICDIHNLYHGFAYNDDGEAVMYEKVGVESQ